MDLNEILSGKVLEINDDNEAKKLFSFLKKKSVIGFSNEERENLVVFLSNTKNEDLAVDYLLHVLDYEYPGPEHSELDELMNSLNIAKNGIEDKNEYLKTLRGIRKELDNWKSWVITKEASKEVTDFIADKRLKKLREIIVNQNIVEDSTGTIDDIIDGMITATVRYDSNGNVINTSEYARKD